MTEHDEDAARVGAALAETVMAEVRERGLLGRAAQDWFATEYDRRARHLRAADIPVVARDYDDPMSREIPESEQSPWQLRRSRDNALAEAAARAATEKYGSDYSAEQYLDALAAQEAQHGIRCGDDKGGRR